MHTFPKKVRFLSLLFALFNIFFWIQKTFSAEVPAPKSLIIGHNLSPTTYTLNAGQLTLGNYAFGVGITDSVSVVTSPWIHFSYNMYNLHLRWGNSWGHQRRWALHSSFFHTYDDDDVDPPEGSERSLLRDILPLTIPYKQTSMTQQLIITQVWGPLWVSHFTLGYHYYWNDDRPYSLRMNSGSSEVEQWNLSTLMEFKQDRLLTLLAEVGILGLNYHRPYIHYGASLALQSDTWLFQFGFSHSLRQKPDDTYSTIFKRTATFHPELQVQYFF